MKLKIFFSTGPIKSIWHKPSLGYGDSCFSCEGPYPLSMEDDSKIANSKYFDDIKLLLQNHWTNLTQLAKNILRMLINHPVQI